jgi:hypothetical protein
VLVEHDSLSATTTDLSALRERSSRWKSSATASVPKPPSRGHLASPRAESLVAVDSQWLLALNPVRTGPNQSRSSSDLNTGATASGMPSDVALRVPRSRGLTTLWRLAARPQDSRARRRAQPPIDTRI